MEKEQKEEKKQEATIYRFRRIAIFENVFDNVDEKGNKKKSHVFYIQKSVMDDKTDEYKEVKGFYIEDLQNLRTIIDAILNVNVTKK